MHQSLFQITVIKHQLSEAGAGLVIFFRMLQKKVQRPDYPRSRLLLFSRAWQTQRLGRRVCIFCGREPQASPPSRPLTHTHAHTRPHTHTGAHTQPGTAAPAPGSNPVHRGRCLMAWALRMCSLLSQPPHPEPRAPSGLPSVAVGLHLGTFTTGASCIPLCRKAGGPLAGVSPQGRAVEPGKAGFFPRLPLLRRDIRAGGRLWGGRVQRGPVLQRTRAPFPSCSSPSWR